MILRCGDLIGPRDTTLRWWQYQVIHRTFSLWFLTPGETYIIVLFVKLISESNGFDIQG